MPVSEARSNISIADGRPWRFPPAALAALLLAGAAASGCVFSNMTLRPPAHAKVTSATTPVAQGREILLVVPFTDQRPIKDQCGMKKNGFNMVTSRIDCSAPPDQFLSQLLGQELTAAGFKVVTDPAQATSAAIRIEGVLLQFFAEPHAAYTTTPEADIELRLLASSASGLQAQRRFYVKARELSLSGADLNFQLAANDAIKQVLNRSVAAILELLQQFPQLGLPAQEELAARRSVGKTVWR